MASAERAVVRVAQGGVRTGAIVIAASAAGLVWVGVTAYHVAGPALGGTSFTTLTNNAALRALYGVPYAINSAGGFTVWREGSFIAVVVGVWAVLAATRILRGAEDDGRWDLLLAEPVPPTRALYLHLLVLSATALLVGVAVAGTFIVLGEAARGSLLFGAGVGLVMLTFLGLGALTSQLFAPRRRAAGVAGALVGAAYVTRMVADTADSRVWLRWTTPFGWLEQLQPFAGDKLIPLVPLVLVPLVLFGVAVAARRRRDLGAGLVRTSEKASPRLALLRSPTGFALRVRLGGLVAWAAGLAVFSFVLGFITDAFTRFAQTDYQYAQTVQKMGFGDLLTTKGFVATMDALLAVTFALYVVSGIHAEWSDEQDRRIEVPFANGVARERWLSAAAAAIAACSVVIVVAVGIGTWIGAAASSSDLGLRDSMVGALNTLPIVALALGLMVALHGTMPRWATPIGAATCVIVYVLALFGPALHWPTWVISLSPFHHVAAAPAQSVAWTATFTMVAISLIAMGLGLEAYRRRDLA
jgi:ABC-2 type transport system permease protein